MSEEAINAFFKTFQHDWPAFRALWIDEPTMAMPFAPPGFEKVYAGANNFDAFWHPVFNIIKGSFVWSVRQVSPLPNSNEFLVLASSKVNAEMDGKPLRYSGDYVQIFRFEGSRIAQLTEYFDSHKMALVYSDITGAR